MSNELFLVLILFFVSVLYLRCQRRSHFNARPNQQEIEEFAEQVKQNSGIIGKSLDTAKGKMPWMDAVTYEDLRHLANKGQLTKDAIKQTLV
jgi:hypothetical protein